MIENPDCEVPGFFLIDVHQPAVTDSVNRFGARYDAMSERFQAKACPALDAGWIPVRVKKTRQTKD
jgi:hypothetical protein